MLSVGYQNAESGFVINLMKTNRRHPISGNNYEDASIKIVTIGYLFYE